MVSLTSLQIAFFLLFSPLIHSYSLNNTLHEKFSKWMIKHGKEYSSHEERQRRLNIFINNVNFIEKFNRERKYNYTLSLNHLADLTNEEFKSKYNGVKIPNLAWSPSKQPLNFTLRLPVSIDWRSSGAVTPIKNQGSCRSCWAFAAVAAMEGIVKIKTGKQVSLSEQELVDCDTASYGCDGGWTDKAFELVISRGGISTEAEYPYKGVVEKCRLNKVRDDHAASIKSYSTVPRKNESVLMAVVSQQPVVVYIDSAGDAFQFYSGDGIFEGPCGIDFDHAVVLIGYGQDKAGKKYWIAKNSWGTSWGDKGYMYIAKNVRAREGMCGLALYGYYPII
ncbi:hypothetical protein LUZ60_008067 [Juncus effusus]|nr:hypothetical protein LUZ60_008067 [Juncus effusus]